MRNILNINAGWIFAKGVAETPAALPEGESVCLPHTWNAIDGQDGGNDYFRGTCCYAKALNKTDLPAGEKLYLEVGGANSSADVYFNGIHLTHHDGGYSTFRVELTAHIRDENLLCILVDNAANEEVYPQTADFTFYGGLYRDVNLIAVHEAHFDLVNHGCPGIHVTPIMDGADAAVTVRDFAVGLQDGDRVVYRILDGENTVVAEQDNGSFRIANAHLWDGIKDPYLYTAEAVILRGDQV